MNDRRPPATVEDVIAVTGLTKRQILKAVRDGRIPGSLVSRQLVMTAGQLDELVAHGLRPKAVKPSYIRKVS